MGFAMVVLGSLGDFSALSLAAQSIVAPVDKALISFKFFLFYVR
jgi:hypothetical protein